jgi:hypothetical protein
MAAPKKDGGLELEMFNDPTFVKRYAEGAEKFTGWYGGKLVEQVKFSNNQDLVILDLACGTAIVSQKIADALSPEQKTKTSLTCADSADNVSWLHVGGLNLSVPELHKNPELVVCS